MRVISICCVAHHSITIHTVHLISRANVMIIQAIMSQPTVDNTYVCDQELFSIIHSSNLGFTLRHKVVLLDVLLKQEFLWSQTSIIWSQVKASTRLQLIIGKLILKSSAKFDVDELYLIALAGTQARKYQYSFLSYGVMWQDAITWLNDGALMGTHSPGIKRADIFSD